MNVHVIGGGPAGLYFAILMKKAWPQTRITVFERNKPDDTFGFGVVFSDQTLAGFESYDLETYRQIVGHFAYWDDIEIHFRGTTHRIGGNGFCGTSRSMLLKILGRRAHSLGIDAEVRLRGRSRRRRRRAAPTWWSPPTASTRAPARRSRTSFKPTIELRPNHFCLDGLGPADGRLQLLLPGDPARHLHRALLPVPARPLDLGDGDRSGDVPARRPRHDGRGGVGAIPRRRVRRGARRPQAHHQPLAVAELPDHPLREMDRRQHRADRRRQGDRAFLDRLGHQARDGGRHRALRGVPLHRRPRRQERRWPVSSRRGARRSRRPSTPPTSRWSGSSTSSASGTWTRRASRSG